MADQLLIRAFDVGLGDCVYCRIPDAHRDGDAFHMLIDCGSLSGSDLLKVAVERLKAELPDAGGGRKRLDLLVVTHEHKDHMSGFGLPIWDDLAIGAIWMNAAMDPAHPQADKARALRGAARSLMAEALRSNAAMSPELRAFAEATAFTNDAAMKALREGLPHRNGIDPTYVYAGSAAAAALPLTGATLAILGPERDIDGYYLGEDGDASLRGLMAGLAGSSPTPTPLVLADASLSTPGNLAPADFRRLRVRMQSSAFAFANLDGKVTNNTSIVILLEWKGRRLLFVGDAEWDAKYRPGKGNCAWNVMWTERLEQLARPIHFLKIGHHGSVNATPWGKAGSQPADILDAILPRDGRSQARAIVSTRRANYETIPRSELLAIIGDRVANTRNYAEAFATGHVATSDVPKFQDFEGDWFGERQPIRTDFERLLGGPGYVDVTIGPSDD